MALVTIQNLLKQYEAELKNNFHSFGGSQQLFFPPSIVKKQDSFPMTSKLMNT